MELETDNMDATMTATQHSLNRVQKYIENTMNYRSMVLKTVGAIFIPALILYFSISNQWIANPKAATLMGYIPIGMFIGNVGLIWLDWGWLSKENRAIKDGIRVETTTGTSLNSFEYYQQGVLTQLRFILCYTFLLIVASALFAKDHGYINLFTAL